MGSSGGVDIKFDFTPYDGTPGEKFEKFEQDLMNAGAKADDRGFSYSDHFLGIDELGPAYAGPPPAGAAEVRKAGVAQRQRAKGSYRLLVQHLTHQDHLVQLKANHFQDGRAAWLYIQASCQRIVNKVRLQEMEGEWLKLDLLADVGVNENSISGMYAKIKALNAKRPLADRKSLTQQAERLLELIFQCSKHFHTEATTEYNALPGARRFEIAAGPLAGERDFDALSQHFQTSWQTAVASKLAGFHTRAPSARPPTHTRQTLESGLRAYEGFAARDLFGNPALSYCPSSSSGTASSEQGYYVGEGDDEDEGARHRRAYYADAGSTDYHVPRAGSPSRSLALLAQHGDDLAQRHGTTTTTDFGELFVEELAQLCADGWISEAELCHLFDADDTAIVEIICNICRGLGHVARVCPSNKNRARSYAYCIAALRAAQLKADKRGPPRRPPGRGQRPPFRQQPRRFQPRQSLSPPSSASSLSSRGRGGRYQRQRQQARIADEELGDGSELFVESETGNAARESEAPVERETAKGASEEPKARSASEAGQPLIFSDDALYAQGDRSERRETARVAVEAGATISFPPGLSSSAIDLPTARVGIAPDSTCEAETHIADAIDVAETSVPVERCTVREPSGMSGRQKNRARIAAYSLCALAVSYAVAALEGMERLVLAGGSVFLMLCLVLTLGFGAPLERAYGGEEFGLIMSRGSGLCCTVDSGCTSTAIPLSRRGIIKRVTDPDPGQKIWIANDKGLDIVEIGEAEFEVDGLELERKEGAPPPSWNETRCTAKIPSSRTLVVDGLGEDTILFSVRGLKKDGVKVFFNTDNSIQREDCLLLSDQRTVIPFIGSVAYQVRMRDERAGAAVEACGAGEEADTSIRGSATRHPGAVRSERQPMLFHNATGHIGERRQRDANLTIDGKSLSKIPHIKSHGASCRGCRLGHTGHARVPRRRPSAYVPGASAGQFVSFGQQVDSDVCEGFEPSFPHGFTSMINFVDRYSAFTGLYFLRSATSDEIASGLEGFALEHESLLPNGQIGRWLCDNSTSFLGSDVRDAANFLVSKRAFQVPNEKNTLAVPERHWNSLERMMRAFMAQVEPQVVAGSTDSIKSGAPQCLWTWAARQANLLLYFLPTSSHQPPVSPYQFLTGDTEPQDISWARTMFCDVTVTITEQDVASGKLSQRSVDGCHLGYDNKRGQHFVYVEALRRLSVYVVKEWRELSFTMVHRISADTPVNYADADDMPTAVATQRATRRRYTARGAAAAAAQEAPLNMLALFNRERQNGIVDYFRRDGHQATSRDILNSPKEDLADPSTQQQILDSIPTYNFVFMSPPCTTACIAFQPTLRPLPDHPRGDPMMLTKHKKLVDIHNVLFDFTAEVIHRCNQCNVPWAVESCASRRFDDAAKWPRFERSGMIWDYPPIARIMQSTTATYRCAAQCMWGSDSQKYTGLLTSGGPATLAFDRVFEHGTCVCESHKTVLRGYDEEGEAKTAASAEYGPGFAQALATGAIDSARDQEGAELAWSTSLSNLNQTELSHQLAESLLLSVESPQAPVTSGLTRAEIAELHSRAYREREDVSPELEILLQDAEGAYISLVHASPDDTISIRDDKGIERAYKVSEVGSDLAAIKTVSEARASKFWPLFKEAMEEEIRGKMLNNAWKVVKRPKDKSVHKSRWVFAVKLNIDGSVEKVKARFVGCGYSMQKGTEYDNVFAATLPGISLRMLLAWIAVERLMTDNIDAVKAFTQAEIDREVYVEMPDGFAVQDYVCLLLAALEGIKQGAYLWFALNRAAWLKLGFKSYMNETNLYYHPTLKIRIGVFADDLLTGFREEVRNEYLAIKAEYASIIRITGGDKISPIVRFTGVQIERSRENNTLTIHQERYIEQLAEKHKGEFKEYDTPFGDTKEQRSAFDKLTENTTSPEIEVVKFLKLMGELVWPSSMTRVDIAMAVSLLCSCVSCPRECHYNAGLVVLGYLVRTKRLGITYGGKLRVPIGLSEFPVGFEESCGLYCAHDSSWGTRPRPMGGYVVMYNNGAVDWGSKGVKIVPDSSCEAETAVASVAAKATCFSRELNKFHGRKLKGPTAMLGDNKAMYDIVQQEGASSRTRYYERATLLIKRTVLLLIAKPYLIRTTDMIADIFTKAVEKNAFVKFRNVIMNVHSGMQAMLAIAVSYLHGDARYLATRLANKL